MSSPDRVLQFGTVIQHADSATIVGAESSLIVAQAATVQSQNDAVVYAGAVQNLRAETVHIHPPVPLTLEQIEQLENEFLCAVMARTRQQTKGGVTSGYRRQRLVEPAQQFTPQMKVIDFYGGCLAKSPHVGEYVKEEAFTMEGSKNKGKDWVKLEEILCFNNDERKKAIVGQAGSGKTTLMKRVARDIVDNRLAISRKGGPPDPVTFVHFLRIRDIPTCEAITPRDLLFGKVMSDVSDEALEHGFKWLCKNQRKSVIFLDGLDEARWTLRNEHNMMRYEDSASTSAVMANIMEGNLLPDVVIIVSSREHAVSPLTGDLRPDVVMGLAGFTLEDRRRAFIELVGPEGDALWNLLISRSPELVPLCSIPLFLIFLAIVYKSNPARPPSTMSGVMISVLQIFMQSEHAHERQNIIQTIKKLRALSFESTKQGKVLFTVNDLKEFDLIPKSVRDLVAFVPGETVLGQYLMEGHYRLYFCHQSIQEMLAALSIIELEPRSFQLFVEESLHKPHWSIVRRFVCGVLLNDETLESAHNIFPKVDDTREKQDLLKRSLCGQLQATKNPREKLEIFSSLLEIKNRGFVWPALEIIDFEDQLFAPHDIYAISSFLRQSSSIKKLRMENCNLNPEALDILRKELEHSNVKIKEVNFGRNKCMGKAGLRALGAIVRGCKVENLALSRCDLKAEEFECFRESVKDSKISRIDLFGKNIDRDAMLVLCTIIQQCSVHEFIARECVIEDFKLPACKSGKFCVYGRKLGIEEMSVFGAVLRTYDEMITVIMRNCLLKSDALKSFRKAVGETVKFKKLDIGNNQHMGSDSMIEIAEIMKQCRVPVLTMSRCDLKPSYLRKFLQAINTAKITYLNLHGNVRMGKEGLKTLGSVIVNCQIDKLNISWCKLKPEQIGTLREAIAKSQLKTLDLSRSTWIEAPTEAETKAIFDLLGECNLEKLVLKNWRFPDNVTSQLTGNAGITQISDEKSDSGSAQNY